MEIKRIMQSLAFTGGVLGFAGLLNYKINHFAVSENLLFYNAENFFEWKGCRIFYKQSGIKGSPLLLLHDINAASSAEEWTNILSELSENHRVYVLDLLGCGRSDKPAITYTNFLYVEIILEFIKSVICEKTFVIASSDTSQIALMASAYDSSKFSGFVFINPPSIEATGRTPDSRTGLVMKLLQFPIVGSLLYNEIYSRKNIEMNFKEDYFFDPSKVTSKLLQIYYESAHLQNGNGRYLEASYVGRYLNMDINHALKKSTLPLSIYYSDSYKNKELIARSWKKRNSGIVLTKLTHTGLYPQLEMPKRTAALIEASLLRAMRSRCTLH